MNAGAKNEGNSLTIEKALEVVKSGEDGYFDEEGYWVDDSLFEEAISVLKEAAGNYDYFDLWLSEDEELPA
jgi:two-component SAPR family response regulator